MDNIHTKESKEELKTTSHSDSMYSKLQNQLKALENKETQKIGQNRNKKNNVSASKKEIIKSQEKLDEEFIDEVNQSYDDFFNTKPVVSKTKSNSIINSTNPFGAVIHNDQVIKNNSRVKLRLTEDAIINGKRFSKNKFIYGFARFSQNRVMLKINKVGQDDVNLVAYDKQDGNKGIYVEGANFIGEVSNEGKDDVLDEVESQNGTVNSIKNIIKRKNRASKIELLNNYELILKNEN